MIRTAAGLGGPMTLWLGLISGCNTAPPGQEATEAPATAHWMADVFADRTETPLGRVLLPGAFNSSSYACAAEHGISPDAPAAVLALWGADDGSGDDGLRERIVAWSKTQGRPLRTQLEDGIRFLEVNVTLKDGVVTTWHSVYGVPIDEVLDEVVAFAVDWPDEVLVLSFGVHLDPADWPLFAEALVAPRAEDLSLCDLVYNGAQPAASTPLGDLRALGRNVVWAPEGELRDYLVSRGDCPLSQGASERIWSLTVSPEGVAEALDGSVDTRALDELLINDFVFSLDGAASVAEQLDYTLSYMGVQDASQALGFSSDFPGRLIESHDARGNMNIFAGAYYEDTNLVEAAIAANRAR